MNSKPFLVTVGTIVKPQKLDGTVKVFPQTDYPERILDMKEILVENQKKLELMKIENVSLVKGILNLKFAGVDSKEDAEKLRGAFLKITKSQLKPLEKGEYYIFELIGLKVIKTDGEVLGELIDILKTGANDVYVVKLLNGEELLIPALKSVVKKIDLQNLIIEVELLPGLGD